MSIERPNPQQPDNEQQSLDEIIHPTAEFVADEDSHFITLTEDGFDPYITFIQGKNLRTVFMRMYHNPRQWVDVSDMNNPQYVIRTLRERFEEDTSDSDLIEAQKIDNRYHMRINAQTPFTVRDKEQDKQKLIQFQTQLTQTIGHILRNPNTPLDEVLIMIGPHPETGELLSWDKARSEAHRMSIKIRARVKMKSANEQEQQVWDELRSRSGYKRDHEVLQNYVPELMNWFGRAYELSRHIPNETTQATSGQTMETPLQLGQPVVISPEQPLPLIDKQLSTTPIKSPEQLAREREIRQEVRLIVADIQSKGIPRVTSGRQLAAYYSGLHPNLQREYAKRKIVSPKMGKNDNRHPAYEHLDIVMMRYAYITNTAPRNDNLDLIRSIAQDELSKERRKKKTR